VHEQTAADGFVAAKRTIIRGALCARFIFGRARNRDALPHELLANLSIPF
jgi:hypothetical protein